MLAFVCLWPLAFLAALSSVAGVLVELPRRVSSESFLSFLVLVLALALCALCLFLFVAEQGHLRTTRTRVSHLFHLAGRASRERQRLHNFIDI